MAGLRVTAIPYRGAFLSGQLEENSDGNHWYIFVLVTDPDGTPRTGLTLSNFTVRIHAQGTYGPFDYQANTFLDQLNQKVPLGMALEAKYAPGVYTLEFAQGAVTADTPYVFSVSAHIPPALPFPGLSGTTGRALASFRLAEWSDTYHGPSV